MTLAIPGAPTFALSHGELMTEEELFHEALGKANAEERAAFLGAACAGQPELRKAVEVLLAAARPDNFLNQPAIAHRAASAGHASNRDGPGTIIGPYKLMEQIGEGGMGLVFVAEQQQPVRRMVAVKVIKPGMDTRQVIARFEAERQALALMDHPNIARVLDAGTTPSGRPYFVMELVRGVPITDFCDANRLTLRERLELFIDVCNAVQHAHQKGIIHRDLKASNILITLHDATPVVKVIDFGVVKAIGQQLTERTIYTRFTEMIGTPLYMSPEQAEMSGLDIDTRTDIYSLGVLLYELLTSTTPFDTERLRTVAFDEMRRIIREEEPPRPSRRISTLATSECGRLTPLSSAEPAVDRPSERPQSGRVTNESGVKPLHSKDVKTIAAQRRIEPRKLSQLFRGELDWIVMRAMEKNRKRRYETASAFAADVRRYLHDERVLACPPTAGYRVRKFVRRNKGPVFAGTLVLLALVCGIIGTTWQMILATAARATAENESTKKEEALATAQQSEQDARDKLFLALWSQARAGRFSHQMGQRLHSLAAVSQAAQLKPAEQLRDEAIAAMALCDIRRALGRHTAWPTGTSTAAYGGQYRHYARADTHGVISIRKIPDDEEIQHIVSGGIAPGDHLYFSPDERFLTSFGEGQTLRVWRVADGQLIIRDESRQWAACAFSPDGRSVAASQLESVACFDLATGQEITRWRLPARPCNLDFHPSSRKLAVGYFSSNVVTVHDAANGSLVASLPVGLMINHVIAWHPDGDRLAVSGSDPRIQIWNVTAERKVETLEGHVNNVTALTFHPEGGLLASHSWDGTLRLWDSATGRPLLQCPLIVADRPRFSGDGRYLAAALDGEMAQILEVTATREYRTLVSSAGTGLQGTWYYGDISPDGRLLTIGMDEGARLWDLSSGRELAALPAQTRFCFFNTAGRREDGSTTVTIPPLVTSGSEGLLRWPITTSESQPPHATPIMAAKRSESEADVRFLGNDTERIRLRLGPPQLLSPLQRVWYARRPDGSTQVAATDERRTNQILDLDSGTVRQELGGHPNGEVRAISPDGRWAVSCGWHSDRVRLWNAGTGEMVKEWVVGKQTAAFFTPDSGTLIIARGEGFSFWDVESLQPIRRLSREVAQYPGWVAFSPDGRLMALEMSPGVMHLIDTATCRTIAKLEDPHGDRAIWQAFTPDGTQLIVLASFARAIHVWDLRAIRTRLKEMNLDWDWPEFEPTSSPNAPREEIGSLAERDCYEHVTIEIDLGHLARTELTREQRVRLAIERGRRALEADPNSAPACNELAWVLATAPESARNVEEAVALAGKAVRLASKDPRYRNTLGVAYYRAGRYRDAVETLQPNLAIQNDSALAFDLYFLAMCHYELGDATRARDYYELAVRWTNAQKKLSPTYIEELTEFRAEAEALLNMQTSQKNRNDSQSVAQ